MYNAPESPRDSVQQREISVPELYGLRRRLLIMSTGQPEALIDHLRLQLQCELHLSLHLLTGISHRRKHQCHSSKQPNLSHCCVSLKQAVRETPQMVFRTALGPQASGRTVAAKCSHASFARLCSQKGQCAAPDSSLEHSIGACTACARKCTQPAACMEYECPYPYSSH